jgi:hypothetical protein
VVEQVLALMRMDGPPPGAYLCDRAQLRRVADRATNVVIAVYVSSGEAAGWAELGLG